MEKKIQGVLITGAAGGLGQQVLTKVHNAGYEVICTDVKIASLQNENKKPGVIVQEMDITSPDSIQNLISSLKEKRIDIKHIIHCVGLYSSFAVSEAPPSLFKKHMEVNFLGLQSIVSAFLPSLIKSIGRVIVITSVSVKVPAPFQPYIIGKTALEALANGIRQELLLKGVELIMVRPGAIQTPLLSWMDNYENPVENSVFEREMAKAHADSLQYVGKVVPADTVAEVVLKALTTRKPKRIYNVNHSLIMKVAGILPGRFRERLILRRFKDI